MVFVDHSGVLHMTTIDRPAKVGRRLSLKSAFVPQNQFEYSLIFIKCP